MKVLHISHLYPYDNNRLKGVAIHNLVSAIRKRGVEQKVIAPIPFVPFPLNYFSSKWHNFSTVPGSKVYEGIEVYHPRYLTFPKALFHSTSGTRMYWGIRGIANSLNISERFDIIHTHMGFPDGYAGLKLSKENNKPLIVTMRSSDIVHSAKKNEACLARLQKVASQARSVITPSPQLAKDVNSLLNIEPVVVPNGLKINELPQINSRLNLDSKNRRIITSVSRLVASKGIHLNLEAMAKLIEEYDDLLYLVVGDGPERDRLKKITRDLNITDHVEFTGHVDHNKALKYMALSDIFVLPSYRETFGLVYIEAMALGTPAIGVRGTGIDGVIKNKKTGLLVEPKDKGEIIKAVKYLLDRPTLAKKIGEKSRKHVKQNYTWSKSAEKAINVYEETLHRI